MTKPLRKTQAVKQHPGTRKVGKVKMIKIKIKIKIKNAWSEDNFM